MLQRDQITLVYIVLKRVETIQVMVLLSADGTVNRTGFLEVDAPNLPFTMGLGDLGMFERVRAGLPEAWIERMGQGYTSREILGDPMELVVGLRVPEGETAVDFRYGSDSAEPPADLMDFVRLALAETDAWYQASNPRKTSTPT